MVDDINQQDMKEFRKNNPSGWMEITRYEAVRFAIDALLDSPSSREFSVAELARKSGMSANSIHNHIGYLVERGILDPHDDRKSTRYTLNTKSPIVKSIISLDDVVSRTRIGDLPKKVSSDRSIKPGSVEDINVLWEEEGDQYRTSPFGMNTRSAQIITAD